MNLVHLFVRRVVLVALAAPLVLAGCGGSSFSAGSSEPDGSLADGAPDGDIIVGPDGGSPNRDATAPHDGSPEHDARADGHEDAAPGEEGGTSEAGEAGESDSATLPETGADAVADAPAEAPGCPTGYLDCSGTCKQEGLTNCGSCGHDCTSLPHVVGGVTCTAGGQCSFTNADCAPGWAHCTANPDDGCETSTTKSPDCGGCGVTCSGGTPQCNGTMCVSGCTAPKSTLCNGTTCVDTTSDPQNCNGCGDACPAGPANSTPTCTTSKCGYACNGGYTGCPVGAPTTCENLTDDPNNCGACAHVCHAPANGATSCVSSNCTPACPVGAPDLCANEGANGTCVNFGTDTSNCGGCGNKCPGPVAGTGTATCNSTCGVTCSGSTPDACGIEPSISCVNFTDDVDDCGTCGNACGKGSNKLPPANGSSICASSTCDFQCTAGYTKCEAQWQCLAPPVTGAAFVALGSGFVAGTCGTAAKPCENLADGVAYAKAQGYANLYLAHGTTYGASDGPIALDPTTPLAVHGGWTYAAGTWTPDCAPVASSTVIVAPAGASAAVEVTGGIVTLDTLTIHNNTAATAGQSLYGVLVTGGQAVTLTNVDIQVAAGGAGSPGGTGANAQVLGSCAADTGANGTIAGTTGNAGAASYTSGGYVSVAGGVGGTGASGANGTAAPTPAPCVNVVACKNQLGSCQVSSSQSCGSVGSNGCGTTGAGGGGGGGGGGASIGIYVWGSTTVSMTGGAITTGNGGNGGSGGAPGSQLAGTLGQPGNPGGTVCEQAANCGTVPSCALNCAKTGSAAGGAAGGNGGEGAAGGQGGGGAGGDSHCYATGGGAGFTLGSATCTTGSAGTAGSPNGPPGSNAQHN